MLAPVVSRRQHLKLYDLDRPEIPSFLVLAMNNQFDTFDMQILDRPLGMFVPTRKFPHKFPRGLDHFNCHEIIAGGNVDLRFKLRGQFRRYKKMRVTDARWLCAPVDKTHDGRDFDARNPGAYLLCYDVSDRRARPKRKRLISNQFEKRRRIVAKRTAELCVPSSLVHIS